MIRARAGGDDGGLADVQHVERDLGFHGGAFVAGERFVEAAGFVGFVAEIFHRFVVQEGVDGFRLGLGIAVVHALAEADAPGGEGEGEGDVDGDGAEGEEGELPVEDAPHDGGDHEELGQGGDDVEDGEAEHLLDAGGAAFDGAGDAAGLAVEVEAHREAMHVLEGLQGDAADGALLDGGEGGVTQLAEAGGGEAEEAVGDDEGGGDDDDAGGARAE